MPADNATVLRGKDIVRYTTDAVRQWSSTAGSLFKDAAATIPYNGEYVLEVFLRAQNKTSTGVVKTYDNAIIHNVAITGVFPAVPHIPHEWKGTKRGVVRVDKRDGSVSGKIHGSGLYVRDFKLAGRLRTKAEIAEVEQFVSDHYPFGRFIYEDKWIVNHTGTYIFDSEFNGKAAGVQHGEFDLAIRQVG